MFTLDSVFPRFPLTCITKNSRDLAICCPTGIYVLEDYGMQPMKRRFFPLEQEFRAITYTASNSVQIIALASDGRSIWLFDALEGNLKLLHESFTDKFTTIQMKNETELLIGTFSGEIATKSLQNDSLESEKYSQYPIISICSDLNHFIDSQGRLFSNGKVIFDDGILQPCRLLKSKSSNNLYLVKHCSIYIFDNDDKHIKTITITGLVRAAELNQDGNLVIATGTGMIFLVDGDFNMKEVFKSTYEAQEDSDNESENSEEESEFETEDLRKSEQVYGTIMNPNSSDILALKVDPINRRSWIESLVSSQTSLVRNDLTPTIEHQTVKIPCPLCCDNKQQRLPINTTTCTKGHPITICAQTGNLITTKCYRCRSCCSAFSTKPEICPFCKGLITK